MRFLLKGFSASYLRLSAMRLAAVLFGAALLLAPAASAQQTSYVPFGEVEAAGVRQYGTECPYTETRYEASPLDRPSRSYRPGQCGIFQETIYGVDGRGLAFQETTDEEGRQRRRYQDGFGRVAETVGAPGTDALEAATGFTYDAAGRLTRSIDPEGRPTTYRYDGRGLLVAKATPDADGNGNGDPTDETVAPGQPPEPDTEYAYGRAGDVRFWQDARLRADGRVGFQRYDGLGRPTVRGVAPLPQGTNFSGLDARRAAPYAFETDEEHWTEARAYDAPARLDTEPWSLLSSVHVIGGWALVSLPVATEETHYDSLFADVTIFQEPHAYDGSYVEVEHLEPGRGYWMYVDQSGGTQAFEGTQLESITLDIRRGWNVIGGPSCPLPIAEAEDPAGILDPSTLYTWHDGEYVYVDVLQPGRGYWVYASAAGQVTLDCAAATKGKGRLTAVASRAAAPAGDFRYGDANGDGALSGQDLTLIEEHLAGSVPLAGTALVAADVSGDGAVSARDLTLAEQRVAGDISELPAEERPWHVERYGYDREGRVALRQVVAQGQRRLDAVVRSGYDRQGRLTWRQALAGGELLGQWFEYNARGLVEAMYAADSSGELPTRPAAPEVTYTYATDGQLASVRHAGQPAAIRSYDAEGQLAQIDNQRYNPNQTGFGARYRYYDNGDVRRASFVQKNRPTGKPPRYRYVYSYDALGRLAGADYSYFDYYAGGWQASSAYDVGGPAAAGAGGGITYDRSGNVTGLQRRGEGGPLVDDLGYTYAAGANRLMQVSDAAGAAHDWDAASGSFAYDANGAVTRAPAPYALEGVLYDADAGTGSGAGRAVALSAGGQLARYRYNAAGQRYLKAGGSAGGGGTYSLLGAGGETLGRFTATRRDSSGAVAAGSGALKSWNLALPSGTGAPAGRIEPGGARRYYLTDRLGSVRTVVAEGGGVVETRDYYPFGLRMPGRTGASGAPAEEGFTGHERDEKTQLLYAGARYLMPALARWTTTDPILRGGNPKGVLEKDPRLIGRSPYNYAFNNPTNLTDPTGMAPMDWFRDRDGQIKYDENVQSQADLSEGQQYLGESVLVETKQGGAQLLTGEGNVVDVFEGEQTTGEEAALAASGASAAAGKSQLTLKAAGEAAEGLAKRNAVAGTVLSAGSFIFSAASGNSGSTTYQSVKLTTNLGLAAAGTNPIGAIVGFGLDASGLKDGFVETVTMQILKQQVDQTLEEEPRVER